MLRATQDLLVEEGFERLTMDAVSKRCGASKATIYRRWPSKTALVAAAAADLFTAPELPDTGSLRGDLLACGRAYLQHDGRTDQVLASVITASRHNSDLREAAQKAIAAPYGALFRGVLVRAAERGLIPATTDIETFVEIFPAVAYHRVGALGQVVVEADVLRVVDEVLLPALRP